MVIVEYSHNNSGGFDWLDEEDWKNLEAAGWTLEFHSAYKAFPSLSDGIDEWVEITGQDPDAEGCECCGLPHTFWDTSLEEWERIHSPVDAVSG